MCNVDDKGEGLSALPIPIVLWVQLLIHSFIFAENIFSYNCVFLSW